MNGKLLKQKLVIDTLVTPKVMYFINVPIKRKIKSVPT